MKYFEDRCFQKQSEQKDNLASSVRRVPSTTPKTVNMPKDEALRVGFDGGANLDGSKLKA
jgi:hypothetical protein